jgi:23S rRNA (cytosine1962-C5)-methyltransferase
MGLCVFFNPKVEKPVMGLNLFGYTGAITMAAAEQGGNHSFGSQKKCGLGKGKSKISSLELKPFAGIKDDGLKFVQREARRGSFFKEFILDPPKFGRDPNGDVWDFYKNFRNDTSLSCIFGF